MVPVRLGCVQTGLWIVASGCCSLIPATQKYTGGAEAQFLDKGSIPSDSQRVSTSSEVALYTSKIVQDVHSDNVNHHCEHPLSSVHAPLSSAALPFGLGIEPRVCYHRIFKLDPCAQPSYFMTTKQRKNAPVNDSAFTLTVWPTVPFVSPELVQDYCPIHISLGPESQLPSQQSSASEREFNPHYSVALSQTYYTFIS